MEQTDYVEAFVAALRTGDDEQARAVVARASTAGMHPGQIYLTIFAPSMIRVGDLWEQNELSVAEEHMATAITERLIGELSPLFRETEPRDRRIIIGCVEGENHALGIRMLADLLLQSGWRVLYLGANVPTDEWPRLVDRTKADAVGISVNASRFLPEARHAIAVLRAQRPDIRVLVGGAAFDRAPKLWQEIGADVYERDPHAAIAALDALVEGVTE